MHDESVLSKNKGTPLVTLWLKSKEEHLLFSQERKMPKQANKKKASIFV
jgi:hypothetical protein